MAPVGVDLPLVATLSDCVQGSRRYDRTCFSRSFETAQRLVQFFDRHRSRCSSYGSMLTGRGLDVGGRSR